MGNELSTADAIRLALKVCEERKQDLSKREPEHWADRFWTLDHVQQLIISRAKQAGIEGIEKEEQRNG